MNWLFTDMNSYFASVEQHFRPELRHRPIGVLPVMSEGTCVIAASCDAKRFGIKVGTPVRHARQLCPEITFVQARPDIYVKMHYDILRCVDYCAPVKKVYSIDEWAVELWEKDQPSEMAMALGRRIKQQLLAEFGPWMTCSIGIAPTRLLAKIASDLKKPDGLTCLSVDELPGRLEHWSLKDLCGIGGGMVARLNIHGIQTIPELWEITRQQAIQIWGSVSGANWWAGFHGHDEPELPTHRRSMTHANVLEPRLRNENGARGILIRLTCRLAARLRHEQYFAQRLRIHLKDLAGGYFSDMISLPCVQDTQTLLEQFRKLWQRRIPGRAAPIKVGVDVSDLLPASQVSPSLFTAMAKPQRVSEAVDKINQRWGRSAIYFGSMHDYRHHMDDKIAFGRIPSEV